MATSATALLGLALPVTGELSGTWGDTVNNSLTALLDTAVSGTTTLSSDADVTLTTTTLAANQARQAIILWTAGGTVTRTITAPAQSKPYIVINKTSSSQSIKIVGAGPTTGVTIVAGTAALVAWNGVDFVTVAMMPTAGYAAGILTFLTTPSSANLLAAVTDETGSGALVFGTSPTVNNPTVTNYVESVVAIGTVTSTNTLALTNGTVQTATLTASTACTFTMPTATAGKSFVLLLKQAASTGNGTATFTSVKWGSSGAPTITATAGKMDILTFIADGTNWYGSAAQGYTP
jgi:hypothetical protein